LVLLRRPERCNRVVVHVAFGTLAALLQDERGDDHHLVQAPPSGHCRVGKAGSQQRVDLSRDVDTASVESGQHIDQASIRRRLLLVVPADALADVVRQLDQQTEGFEGFTPLAAILASRRSTRRFCPRSQDR
jgi:hypothetical protein